MDAPSPRTTTITRGQKASMFVGAAAFGSWIAGVFAVFIADQADPMRPAVLVLLGFTVLCYCVVAMVFGAWIGGLVSFVWRSQPGRRIFWRLSGGAVGVMLASLGAGSAVSTGQQWLPLPRDSRGLTEPFLMGCVSLAGMLLGLLIGHAIAARSGDREIVKCPIGCSGRASAIRELE